LTFLSDELKLILKLPLKLPTLTLRMSFCYSLIGNLLGGDVLIVWYVLFWVWVIKM